MLRLCLLLSFSGALFFSSATFAAEKPALSRCGSLIATTKSLLMIGNPIAEIGNRPLSSFSDPGAALRQYVIKLWWHRFLGPKETLGLLRDLKQMEGVPLSERPYGKDTHRSLDAAMLELAVGVTRIANTPYRNHQRLDPKRLFWRPTVKRAASLAKVGATTLLALWILQSAYGYFSARKDGFTELSILESRMSGFRMEFLTRYGFEPPAYLEAADYEALLKGYRLSEGSVHHYIQYHRDNLLKFSQGIAQEQLNCESAVRLKNDKLLRDAIFSIQMQWRDRPDVLRTPVRGQLLQQRIDHILDEFDPERKIWKEAEKLSENSFESAK